MHDSKAILVFGGGGHGKAVIDLIRVLPGYHLAGVVDDHLEPGGFILGAEVLGDSRRLKDLYQQGIHLAANAVGGIGDIQVRVEVFTRLQAAGFELPTLVHPTAFVEASACLEPGAQLFPHAYLGSQASLGFGAILNYGVGVGHDSLIGAYTNISPGSMIAGNARVGERVLIGMNVTINLGVVVGNGARIGNGATVKGDVPEGAVVHAGEVWPSGSLPA